LFFEKENSLLLKSVLNDEKTKTVFFEMNLTVITQLLTVFIIVSVGPAVIAYLAYKKAL
jgi:uncharacterized membrane protein